MLDTGNKIMNNDIILTFKELFFHLSAQKSIIPQAPGADLFLLLKFITPFQTMGFDRPVLYLENSPIFNFAR